jgi:hypothetical protein
MNETPGLPTILLLAARDFVMGAAKLPGISRIALIGYLTTEKACPKDVDLLVAVGPAVAWKPLAVLSRKLMGRTGDAELAREPGPARKRRRR